MELSIRSVHTAVKAQTRLLRPALLWKDRVIGWGNLAVRGGALDADVGFVESRPRERGFKREFDAELERLREFLTRSR